MSAAGSLCLVAQWDGAAIRRVEVRNSRPLAAHLLVGHGVEQAVGLAAALFSLCGRAQGVAARAAIDAALGRPGGGDADAERAVAAEMAQENLWRLLLDWPQLLGGVPRRDDFARAHRALADSGRDPAAAAAVLRELAAEAGVADAAPSLADLARRLHDGGGIGRMLASLMALESERAAPRGATMPLLDAAGWRDRLGGMPPAGFCRRPTLAGEPAETGAAARRLALPAVHELWHSGRRVAARVVARVLELPLLADALLGRGEAPLADAVALGRGLGLARVETARGLLLHAVGMSEAEKVVAYAIVAPTEWNFHPAGAFVKEAGRIAGGGGRDGAMAALRRLALALDPCVSWRVELDGECADA